MTTITQDVEYDNEAKDIFISEIDRLFDRGNCKNVLLVQPLPLNTEHLEIRQIKNKRYYTWQPYGLAVLCDSLKNRGYNVKILDLNYEILNKLSNDAINIDDEACGDMAASLWRSILKQKIETFQPDLIGLTCMFTMGHEMIIRTSDYIKEQWPKLPIIAGGVHITNAPEYFLREAPNIDFVGLYEGDESFCDFIDVVNGKSSVNSLSQIAILQDMKYYSMSKRAAPNSYQINAKPDYDELEIGNYSQLGEVGSYRSWLQKDTRSASVLSNRGCRARCSFCSVRNFNGQSVRSREVNTVVDEIVDLNQKYGIGHVTWIDDDLLWKTNRTLDLFNTLADKNLNLTWCASNGIIASAAAKNPELIEAASRSGCIGLTFGLETGNDDILKAVHKPSRVRHYYKVGELMNKYPQIFTRGFLIIGFPNETLGQILETVKMSQRVGLDWYGVQLLSPLPSTEIYDQMVQLGIIEDATVKRNKDKDKDSSKLFVVRHTNNQRIKEKAQQKQANNFVNPFDVYELSKVPTREELHDIWLLVDYWINYEPILQMVEEAKLNKKRAILIDICDRMTYNNPIANLFLGIVEEKLGNEKEATVRRSKAMKFLAESDYWKKQFSALNLFNLVETSIDEQQCQNAI